MILTLCTLMVFAQGQVYAQANTFFQLLDANSANAGAPPFFPTTQPLNSTIQDTELSGLKEKLKPEPLSTIEEMFNQKLKHSSTTLSPIQNLEDKQPEKSKQTNNISNLLPSYGSLSQLQSVGISTKNALQHRLEFENNLGNATEVNDSNTETVELETDDTMYIRQFGYELFKGERRTLLNASDSVSPDYLLGPGDTLNIYLWGQLQQSSTITLDNDGRLFFPKVGPIHLSGSTLSDAKEIIRSELSQYYNNFEISLSLASSRLVQVFVLGDVNEPGAHLVSATSRVLHALYKANGPKKTGSLRNISVIRNNKVIAKLDLYRYLLHGKHGQDLKLQNNDTILVNSIGPVVSISGSVKRPAIYELGQSSESLAQALGLAGGLMADSYLYRVQVTRIDNGKQRVVKDLNVSSSSELDKRLSKETLRDGDMVEVYSISPKIEEFVEVKGDVHQAGIIAFTPGMDLGSAIDASQGLNDSAYRSRINILRYVSDSEYQLIHVNYEDPLGPSTSIYPKDIIQVFTRQDVLGGATVSIEGAVTSPGVYTLHNNMTVSDIVFLSKPTEYANREFIEIFRRRNSDSPEVISVNLARILSGDDSDIALERNDTIRVYDNIKSKSTRTIELSGEVNRPGVYYIQDGERLNSIIRRAGGFSKRAFLPGAIFTRNKLSDNNVQTQSRIIEDEKKQLIYDQRFLANMSLDSETLTTLMASRANTVAILSQQIQNNLNRTIIHLSRDLESWVDSHDNVLVQSGDKLHVPPVPESIQLVGGVQNQSFFLYKERYEFEDYLVDAGGYSSYADPTRILIFKPDGNVSRDLFNIGPGDSIYIPEKIEVGINWMQLITNITDILSNMVTAVAAIRVLQ